MAEVPEPRDGTADGEATRALETPGWEAPENAGPQPGSYEIRHYGPAKWVSTSVESMDWDSAIQTGFTKLNSYIEGKNEKEMKMKMTAPVTSCVEPGPGPFSESTITVSLYIPSDQQSDPPTPSESDVFIEERAEMTVFVRPTHFGLKNEQICLGRGTPSTVSLCPASSLCVPASHRHYLVFLALLLVSSRTFTNPGQGDRTHAKRM